MHSLRANVNNEIQKMFLKSKVRACFFISILIPAGIALLVSLLHYKAGILAVGANSFPNFILGMFTSVLLPLFIFMWAADSFAGEIGDGTLKITLMRPITRFNVYLSKILALNLASILLLAVILLVSLVCGLLLGGTGSQLLTGFISGIEAYILATVPMVSLVITAVFIAQFFKSSSGALTSSILVFIAGRLLPVVFPVTGKVLFFSYINWHALWLGTVADPARLLYAFLIILSTSLILFTAGFYLFDNKEI